MVHRWKPQVPGDEPGTLCLEGNEAKTTSADVFKKASTHPLFSFTPELKKEFEFFLKCQPIFQKSLWCSEDKVSHREPKLLVANNTQPLTWSHAVNSSSSHHQVDPPSHCCRTNNPNRSSAAHSGWIQLWTCTSFILMLEFHFTDFACDLILDVKSKSRETFQLQIQLESIDLLLKSWLHLWLHLFCKIIHLAE